MRKKTRACMVFFMVSALSSFSSSMAQAPIPVSPAIEKRVDDMLAKMSMDDKLKLIGGTDGFYTQPIPSIGLKPLMMTDGPVGTRTFGPSTAYAAGVALAASWDPELAQRVGASLGEDARARGAHFLLAPGVNIYRSPLNGRNMEYMGEDPYLAGRMAVGYIHGVQSKGVSATVKHFAANNAEFDRNRINAVIDERTLREIYLPAFEAAVKVGHVGSVMNSYNLLNGEHATQNPHLNNDILKGEWGFQGVLMSDWTATYDGIAAANAGLDLEMPFAKLMSLETMTAALKSGQVTMATLDDKVRRILRTAIQFGWLDRDQLNTSIPLDNIEGDHVALEEARESITLLKNDGNLLPLNKTTTKTIAIVGPMAAKAVVGGGGSSNTTPFAADSFVAGFSRYLDGQVKVMYVPAITDIESAIRKTHFRNLKMETTPGRPLPAGVGPDTMADPKGKIDLTSEPSAYAGKSKRYRWTGQYMAEKTAPYILMIAGKDTDSYQVRVNGAETLAHVARDGYRSDPTLTDYAVVKLTVGEATQVEVDYETQIARPYFGVALISQEDLLPPASRKIISEADAVLVTAGFDKASEGESFDRTYRMPAAQNELIAETALLNPKTIVALTAGGAVETAPWIGKVAALLHVYYPGQEGARALAEIVFGERSPEGRLPFSWESTLEENPASAHYAEESETGRAVHYAEGLFLGYRYYTSTGKKPLFPFGFGMSYTGFEFSDLQVKRISRDDVEVRFEVQNQGSQRGATVAEVYVGDPSATVKRPARELKQFAKVRLAAGEKKSVDLHLDRRSFEYYDPASKGWKLDPGEFTVMVGESSESILLVHPLHME